jgi:hypothetical protein
MIDQFLAIGLAAVIVLRMKLEIRMPRFAICSTAFVAISTTAPALGASLRSGVSRRSRRAH